METNTDPAEAARLFSQMVDAMWTVVTNWDQLYAEDDNGDCLLRTLSDEERAIVRSLNTDHICKLDGFVNALQMRI